jgi:hypothetical protein
VFQAICLAWQNRPLDRLSNRLDGWYRFKVRETQKVINKTIYLTVGLNRRQEKSARNVVKQERKH